jgi:hypothetical protein
MPLLFAEELDGVMRIRMAVFLLLFALLIITNEKNPSANNSHIKGRCVQGDCRNGTGLFVWKDGSSYNGSWKSGKRTGWGTFTWPDGSHHAGMWKDNEPFGYGVYVSFYGITYKGNWKGIYIYGNGAVIYEDKSRYEGELDKGKRHGQGTLYDRAGKAVKSGLWRDDEFIKSNSDR